MSHTINRWLGLLCVGALAACTSGGQAPGGGAAGSGGQATPAAGTGGAAGSNGGSSGAPGSGGNAGGDGSGGSAPTGSGGASPPADAGADLTVTPPPDAPASSEAGAPRPKTVLLFTRSGGGYRHESIEPAAAAIRTALMPLGITAEISDQLSHFTAAGLSRFGAVVLVSASGAVLGTPATAEITAFTDYVKGGGGVMAIHAATALSYAGTSPYVQLLGGKFIDHPGGIRGTTCYPEGMHPAVMALPASFPHRDEIYTYSNRRADSQVVLRCDALGGGDRIPLAWHHLEGQGRVFSTGLGHGTELWGAGGRLLKDHVIPAILWTLGM